jgi:hypothetical protein
VDITGAVALSASLPLDAYSTYSSASTLLLEDEMSNYVRESADRDGYFIRECLSLASVLRKEKNLMP